MVTGVPPGTWEAPFPPPREPEGATGTENPWPFGWATLSGGRDETHVAGVVRPNEGNEVRSDGKRGIRASHSTREAGEVSP
jgi:hypothetical protein